MGLKRAYYSDTISGFLTTGTDEIVGRIATASPFDDNAEQKSAWLMQISILQDSLVSFDGRGHISFELAIPRLGRRIDVLCIIDHVVFVLEFKVGQGFHRSASDQALDYALDLKNFHSTSHDVPIVPIVVATNATDSPQSFDFAHHSDTVYHPIDASPDNIDKVIHSIVSKREGPSIDFLEWMDGQYQPTPTIVEAAKALYAKHAIEDISRSEGGSENLKHTTSCVDAVIKDASRNRFKAICFVTGVPGAGKTLVGLDLATKHNDAANELHSVFLSGNGPLVEVMREALTRDAVKRSAENGVKVAKSKARRDVEVFIQNVHHFRDECLRNNGRPPAEHVAIFDEAQRAWNAAQTSSFMKRKKGLPDFSQSEPDFLISCLDRHEDWAVIVCLVGGGQEINIGEAGITEWLDSITTSYPDWRVFISPKLREQDYAANDAIERVEHHGRLELRDKLHLRVSMRSFRAERVSSLVYNILEMNREQATTDLEAIADAYPMYVSRDLLAAKSWLRSNARGTERYGLVVSSQAERLKPHAIDVTSPMNPVHWFLNDKDDVRSAYYLESVATEFHVQGLEVDWACLTWDADFRIVDSSWQHWSFKGNKWQRIHKLDRQKYLKNAYRVLMTRARQGMVIVVPKGDPDDHTRPPSYYDPVFDYLKSIGLPELPT